MPVSGACGSSIATRSPAAMPARRQALARRFDAWLDLVEGEALDLARFRLEDQGEPAAASRPSVAGIDADVEARRHLPAEGGARLLVPVGHRSSRLLRRVSRARPVRPWRSRRPGPHGWRPRWLHARGWPPASPGPARFRRPPRRSRATSRRPCSPA